MLCTLSKVRAEKLVIEMDDVDKGIVMLAAQHGITELVMGAAGDKHCTNEMKIPFSKTALSVQQQVDPSCKIWFVCKGNLIYIREACPNGSTTAESHEARPISANSQSGKSISRSLPQGQKDVGADNARHNSSRHILKEVKEADTPYAKEMIQRIKTVERHTRETMEIELLMS
ncbi:U-box domain-containing protein 33-like isoform X5 [Typha angustifolia]|uniref:U-box domain-containing protein 33-like isoform X5 n=1 Tax=Typha angustifolia TaxID=59011 RepID=UPI003C2DD11F